MVRGGAFRFISFLTFRFISFLIFLLLLHSLLLFAVDTVPTADSTTPATSSSTPPAAVTPTGFNPAKSYSWLLGKANSSALHPVDRAVSNIALLQGENLNLLGLLKDLKDREDATGCWPQGGCVVKDTALATLALALAGQNVSKETDWLKKARVPMNLNGDWWFVIKGNNGNCTFTYPPNGNKKFTLQDDKVKTQGGGLTNGQYYISLRDLNAALKSSLQPQIDISCDSSIGTNPIITLIYKPASSTFFIQRSDAGLTLGLKLANACFGNRVPATQCNYESTAYATWALLELGALSGSSSDQNLSLEGIGTQIYLETQALNKRGDPLALAFLNRILVKSGSVAPSFLTDLVKLQRSDGSWGGDVISTSLSVFALYPTDKSEAVQKGIEFLTKRLTNEQGSAGDNLEATSWALIALHGAELKSSALIGGGELPVSSPPVCGQAGDNNEDGLTDCAEKACEGDLKCQCYNLVKDGEETGEDCGGTCKSCTEDESPIKGDEPIKDGPKEEDSPPEPTSSPPSSEEKSYTWLWILIILVVLGGLGALFYFKYVKTGKVDLGSFFKKKSTGPSFDEFRRGAEFKPLQQQPQRPAFTGARPLQPMRLGTNPKPLQSKSKEEDDLDRSLKEAEKLLKG